MSTRNERTGRSKVLGSGFVIPFIGYELEHSAAGAHGVIETASGEEV
jgi:hypothetical protein